MSILGYGARAFVANSGVPIPYPEGIDVSGIDPRRIGPFTFESGGPYLLPLQSGVGTSGPVDVAPRHVASAGPFASGPAGVRSGHIASGQIATFSVASEGLLSGSIFGGYPTRPIYVCKCCGLTTTNPIQDKITLIQTLFRFSQDYYCLDCIKGTADNTIITRKDLIIARTGLQEETPIGIVLDYMEEREFSAADIEYMRRFIK